MKQSNVLDLIKKTELSRIHRQIAFIDAKQTSVSNKTAKVKALLNSEDLQKDLRLMTAQDLCAMYYNMLGEYRQKAVYTDFSNINKKSIAFWSRVITLCEKLEIHPKDFLQAQFSYFHITFGKAPELSNLLTEKAAERARQAVQLKGRIVATAIDADISKSDIFQQCDRQVRDICRAQKMSRTQFYAQYVLTGIVKLPLYFLNNDPEYQRLIDG